MCICICIYVHLLRVQVYVGRFQRIALNCGVCAAIRIVFVLVHSAHFYACKCKRKSVYPTDWIEPVCLRNCNGCVCTAIRNGTPIVRRQVAIGIGELVRLLPLLPELFARGAAQN